MTAPEARGGEPPAPPPPPADAGASAVAAVPPWFRAVVWDSLLGALCLLLPLPFVDDVALGVMRRRLVERLLARWGVRATPAQIARLAGGSRGWSVGRVVRKVLIYPFKELLRKILYFLTVKDAVDTFSLLFHQAYLLQAALSRGALPAGSAIDEARVAAVADAVHGTLVAVDTRPLRRVLVGVLRNSRRLVVGTVRWLATRMGGRGGAATTISAIADEGSAPALGSPEAEQLLDRLLLVLWGERRHRERLEDELAHRLPSLTIRSTRP